MMKRFFVVLMAIVMALGVVGFASSCGMIEKTDDECAHTWQEVAEEIVAPTCTEKGKIVVKCSKCGEKEESAVDALGHNYGADDKCTVCGESKPGAVTPSDNTPSAENWEKVMTKAADYDLFSLNEYSMRVDDDGTVVTVNSEKDKFFGRVVDGTYKDDVYLIKEDNKIIAHFFENDVYVNVEEYDNVQGAYEETEVDDYVIYTWATKLNALEVTYGEQEYVFTDEEEHFSVTVDGELITKIVDENNDITYTVTYADVTITLPDLSDGPQSGENDGGNDSGNEDGEQTTYVPSAENWEKVMTKAEDYKIFADKEYSIYAETSNGSKHVKNEENKMYYAESRNDEIEEEYYINENDSVNYYLFEDSIYTQFVEGLAANQLLSQYTAYGLCQILNEMEIEYGESTYTFSNEYRTLEVTVENDLIVKIFVEGLIYTVTYGDVTITLPDISGGPQEGGNDGGSSLDSTKTILRIGVNHNGYGIQWIEELAKDFEEMYANTSFEEGKTGVQVIIETDHMLNNVNAHVLESSMHDIVFGDGNYLELIASGLLKDLSEIVSYSNGGTSIESKLHDVDKSYLTQFDGKYYALPHFENFVGLTYNPEFFEEHKLYFSTEIDTDGTREFVFSVSDDKSCGPDGVVGTYDDGLPSSHQEMIKLLLEMKMKGIDGFVWAYMPPSYFNFLLNAMYANYLGVNGINAQYNLDSNGQTVEIVTGFNGEEPIVENIIITKENAYLMKQSYALYKTIEFAETIFDNDFVSEFSHNVSTSFLRAQALFAKSQFEVDNNPIGMLLEGNWWYNEAEGNRIFDEINNMMGEVPEFRFMPLPQQLEGTVLEGAGGAPVMVSDCSDYLFVNANIDHSKMRVISDFIQFCYTDEQLGKQTINTNGVTVAVDYEITDYDFFAMPIFAQSIYKMVGAAKEANTYVRGVFSPEIDVQVQMELSVSPSSNFFSSIIGGSSFMSPVQGMVYNQVSLIDYFKGMWMAKNDWDQLIQTEN